MFDDALKKSISERFDGALFDEPMSAHTTFRVGGTCECYISADEDNTRDIIGFCRENKIEYTVIGNGSNLLCADEGVCGMVINIGGKMNGISNEGTTVFAQAGCRLSALSAYAAKRGLGGLEFAGGIPGNLGGALYMNAGAYGGEMKNVVKTVTYLEDGEIYTKSIDELDFGYRKTYFTGKQCVILSCTIECVRKSEADIRAEMDDYASRRRDKQPLEYPSAGSFFKRPEGHFAGKLIQDAGLRGASVGGAEVSEKHAGFIINTGGATCRDIVSLAELVIKTVYDKFGVRLQPEVRTLGFEFKGE